MQLRNLHWPDAVESMRPILRALQNSLYCFFLRRPASVTRKFPWHTTSMRIAKPLLLVTTPIGLLSGFYECVKLAGGLVFIMFAMVAVMGAATGRRISAAG